jgi:allantoin racemase
MKLAVIIPGDYSKEVCEDRHNYLNTLVSPGTELKIFTTGGTPSLSSIVDIALISSGLVNRSMEAEKEGFDGILIHWMFDDGFAAARAAVEIPVVGLGSALYHIAAQLAGRAGLIVSNEKTLPEHRRRIKSMGFSDHIISIRALDIPAPQMVERKDELEKKFVEIAKYQINGGDAQLIIAGHGGIFPALGSGSRERIEKNLGVPVLDAPGIGLKTLELLVNLKLTHSKKAYPSPTK